MRILKAITANNFSIELSSGIKKLNPKAMIEKTRKKDEQAHCKLRLSPNKHGQYKTI